MPNEQLIPNNIERPECGHVETIYIQPQRSLADYNFRVVPELREALQKPCEQCAKGKLADQESEGTKDKTGGKKENAK